MSHYKNLLSAIKYKIDTKDYFYQRKPDKTLNGPWKLCDYSTIYYTEDNDTRKRVTEYTIIINGSVIAWRFESEIFFT